MIQIVYIVPGSEEFIDFQFRCLTDSRKRGTDVTDPTISPLRVRDLVCFGEYAPLPARPARRRHFDLTLH